MAAVAGHIDHFMIPGDLGQVVHIVQPDPAIQPVPDPVQEQLKEPDDGMGVIRRDFHGIAPGFGFHLLDAGLLTLSLGTDSFLYRNGFHHGIGESAPV